MNKPVDPKTPNALVAVGAPQVPAIPKPISGWKKFRRLCEDIEDIKARYDGDG